jgi:hypothetical protein
MTSYLIFGAIACLYLSYVNEALGAEINLKCETPNEEKIFTVGNNKVTFHKENSFRRARAISSADYETRTQPTNSGFTKVLYIDGHKHRIHIEDLQAMNEVDDFITIVSPKGHTMTYPINCQVL